MVYDYTNWEKNEPLDILARLLAEQVLLEHNIKVVPHPDEKDVDLILTDLLSLEIGYLEVEMNRWWQGGEFYSPIYNALTVPIRKGGNSLRLDKTWYIQFSGMGTNYIMATADRIKFCPVKPGQQNEDYYHVPIEHCLQGKVPEHTDEITKLIKFCRKKELLKW